jgi:hypothetical protein
MIGEGEDCVFLTKKCSLCKKDKAILLEFSYRSHRCKQCSREAQQRSARGAGCDPKNHWKVSKRRSWVIKDLKDDLDRSW